MKKEPTIIGNMGSPVVHTSIEEKEVAEILISYGGGMGGYHEKHYVEKWTEKLRMDEFFQCKQINGRDEVLNPKHIVRIRAGKVVILKTDVTQHSHFNQEKYAKKVIVEYFFFEEGENYKYIADYTDRTEREKRRVLKEIYCT